MPEHEDKNPEPEDQNPKPEDPEVVAHEAEDLPWCAVEGGTCGTRAAD